MHLRVPDKERILLISDLHLGPWDSPQKAIKLAEIINNADRVILLGDFWDGHKWSFDQFINSEYENLFPLLLNKKCIYIVGNHDPRELMDEGNSQFATQVVDNLKLTQSDRLFYLTHGHLELNEISSLIKYPARLIRLIFLVKRIFVPIVNVIFRYVRKSRNRRLLAWKAEHLDNSTTMICGHSHIKACNRQQKFINLGSNYYKIRNYAYLQSGKIEFSSAIA